MISVRQISAIQLKKFCRKGCRVYATHVLEANKNETPRLEDFHVLQELKDVFPDEIPGLPPKRDIEGRIICKNVWRFKDPFSTPEICY